MGEINGEYTVMKTKDMWLAGSCDVFIGKILTEFIRFQKKKQKKLWCAIKFLILKKNVENDLVFFSRLEH